MIYKYFCRTVPIVIHQWIPRAYSIIVKMYRNSGIKPFSYSISFILICFTLLHTVDAQYQSSPSEITPPAFSVLSVEQNVTTQQIVVQLRVGGGSQHVPLLYMSKPDWFDNDPNQPDVRTHPCQPTMDNGEWQDKTCCLKQFVADYQTATDIEDLFENNDNVCDTDGNSIVTNPSKSAAVFEDIHFPEPLIESQLLQDATAGVTYISNVEPESGNYDIEMRFTMEYLDPRTLTTDVPSSVGTFQYEFFIGCVFLGLQTQDNSVNTVVVQENIEFTKSEVGFFTVSTEQDRSAIKSVDAFIHQAQASEQTELAERLLQYIEMDFRYDTSTYENIEVDRTSMRYSRGSSFSDGNDWDNVCVVGNTDNPNSFAVNSNLYGNFSAQTCLPYPPVFCEMQGGRFTFPLSLDGVTNTDPYISEFDAVTSIFIITNVKLKEKDSEKIITSTVYSTINLQALPILKHCTSSVFDYHHVTDVMKITLGVGLRDEDNSLVDVIGTPAPGDRLQDSVVRKLEAVAPTYGAASMNMVVDGSEFFKNSFSTAYKFRIDNMVVMNFLGASSTGYDSLQEEIANGNGFTIGKVGDEKFYTLEPSNPNGATHCTEVSGNEISTTNWNCMWRRVIRNDTVCSPFGESVYFINDKADIEMARDWVKRTFFNVDMTIDATNAYLKIRCPKFFDASFNGNIRDLGDYGCMFIDPGYRWLRAEDAAEKNASLTTLTISDKTVVAGLITIVDEEDRTKRRRLLSMNEDGSNMKMVDLPQFDENDYALNYNNIGGLQDDEMDVDNATNVYGVDSYPNDIDTEPDSNDSLTMDSDLDDVDIEYGRENSTRIEESDEWNDLFGTNWNSTFIDGVVLIQPIFTKQSMKEFKRQWNITTPYSISNGKDDNDVLAPVRRRLLSDKYGTAELFWGKDKKMLTNTQMQKRLSEAFSLRQMENAIVFTPEQMRVRLKASFERFNELNTKLKVKGNHRLSRHLLQAGDEDAIGLHMEKLKNESTNDIFQISNPFSIASSMISRYLRYQKYQMFTFDIEKRTDVNMDVFMNNVNFILEHSSKDMGDRVVTARSTGFMRQKYATTGLEGRRLLQSTAYDGFSSTVSVEGIFEMNKTFGVLFNNMLQCIMAPAADYKMNITLEDIRNVSHTCADASNAIEETNVVRNTLLTACGDGIELLPIETCNHLYRTLVTTAPEIAFDYYATKGEDPTMYFTMGIDAPVTPLNKAAILYRIRRDIASVIGAPVNKVLTDIREWEVFNPSFASNRRLLATDEKSKFLVMVWVYTQDGVNGISEWPVDPGEAAIKTEFETWRTEIKDELSESMGTVIVSEVQVGAPYDVLPLWPQLTDFSLVFTVDVTIDSDSYPQGDIDLISQKIEHHSSELFDVPMADVRILSETRFERTETNSDEISRFSVEVRMVSEKMGLRMKTKLKNSIDDLEVDIKKDIKDETETTVHTVKIHPKHIKNIVDSVVKKPKENTGVPMTVIIILIVILFTAGGGLAYFYNRNKQKDKQKSVEPAVSPPNSSHVQESHIPGLQQGDAMFPRYQYHAPMIPVQSSIYDRNYRY